MPEFVILVVILILVLAGWYSMVTFPKQRDFQKRQRFVQNLEPGSEVITYGGIIGRVVEVRAEQGVLLVEIADGVIVRMIAAAVVQPYDPDVIAENAQKALREQSPQARNE